MVEHTDREIASIVEFIQMGPWRRALFTTYTLSLSYFESEVLPQLLRAGCIDIWVIVDAEGYRSSLLERRSMRVGHEYRLIPLALRNGVFHAKSIYLSGDEGDLLLIGSGNVTFSGHGRNLEIFEALTADTNADAFAEFADYLDAFRERTDLQCARTEWIDEFSTRALIASDTGKGAGPAAARLVHCVRRPVLEQLPDLLQGHSACSAVTVMSPYHDPDGIAVKRLSEILGSIPIAVAVSPASPKSSPFPFATSGAWPISISTVKPRLADKRFAHAKLYEFSCGDELVILTGSINATRKAMLSNENIELGVLRTLSPGTLFLDWEPVSQPTFDPQHRLPSGLGENEIVYATFDRHKADVISGQIISLRGTDGAWAAILTQADGESYGFEVIVGIDGRFSHVDAALERYAEMPALQIEMTRDGHSARGWVHNEMFLSMSGRRRLTAGALSRLIRREGSNDDIEALLDYLSIHAENHLGMFNIPIQKGDEDAPDADAAQEIVTVALDEIAPIVEGPDALVKVEGHPIQLDTFDIAIGRLRKMFLGHGRAKTAAASNYGDSVVAEEDGEDISQPRGKVKTEVDKRGLDDFEERMDLLITEARDSPRSVRSLLVLMLEVGMWMRLHRFNDLNAAHEFLQAWFYRACDLTKPDEGVTSLEQHVVTGSAALFALGGTPKASGGFATRLHDRLEHFYGGEVDPVRLQKALVKDPEIGFGPFLFGDSLQPSLYSDALTSIVAHPTIRKQLSESLALAEAQQPIPAEWEVFRSQPGGELLKVLRSGTQKKQVRTLTRQASGCAFDNFAFSFDIASKYKRYRIGQCIHCKRFTVDLSP